MQTSFFVEIKFWVENLRVKYYKDHVNKNRIEDI